MAESPGGERDAPDPYSNAWYRQQFSGMTHLLNRQANELADQHQALMAVKQQIAKLEAAANQDQTKIGELLNRLEALEAKLDKVSSWLRSKFAKDAKVP